MSESREDYQKRRALDELRKAGAAMPAVDEKGRAINPHIPQYIANAPWYYNTSAPTLKHQDPSLFRQTTAAQGIDTQRNEVVHINTQVKGQRFRSGACDNCGSITHKTKECLERPRRKNARASNTTFGHDLYIKETKLNFEAKRDQYATIDVQEEVAKQLEAHRLREEKLRLEQEKKIEEKLKQQEEHRQLRAEKKTQLKQRKLQQRIDAKKGSDDVSLTVDDMSTDSDWDSSEDELDTDDEADAAQEVIGSNLVNAKLKADPTAPQGPQSMRIREDTAKYLLNLDVNSAYYDPKTRSLRENPFSPDDPRYVLYAGDNQLRQGGDTEKLRELTKFAHQIQEVADVHVSAFSDPTTLELQHRQFTETKQKIEEEKQKIIKERFANDLQTAPQLASEFDDEDDGGQLNQQHHALSDAPRGSASSVSPGDKQSALRDISSGGQDHPFGLFGAPQSVVIKEKPKRLGILPIPSHQSEADPTTTPASSSRRMAVSRYAEDVYEGNHTAIWGSFYDISQKKWGYACCQSLMRGSYCVPIKKAVKRPRPVESD